MLHYVYPNKIMYLIYVFADTPLTEAVTLEDSSMLTLQQVP